MKKTIRRDEWEWVWRKWVASGYRKASDIQFQGYCTTLKINTEYGDIFCVVDKSPMIIKRRKALISELYTKSGETPPIFVPIKTFRRIENIEHG